LVCLSQRVKGRDGFFRIPNIANQIAAYYSQHLKIMPILADM